MVISKKIGLTLVLIIQLYSQTGLLMVEAFNICNFIFKFMKGVVLDILYSIKIDKFKLLIFRFIQIICLIDKKQQKR